MRSPNPKIYGHFERLIPIRILDRTFEVPEGIPLIRAFQYIQFELDGLRCDWSRFCFNDTIGCCESQLAPPGRPPALGRACCQRVYEGLVVHTLPTGCTLRGSAP